MTEIKNKLPAVIKIGGLDIAVVEVDQLASNRGSFGEFSFMEQKIMLDPALPTNKKMATFVHELLEALNGYLELDMPHEKLSVLAFSLHQILHDNQLEF